MPRTKANIYTLIKWLIMLAAYGFLIYKLAHIEYWNELKNSFKTLSVERVLLLFSVLFLMPVNWFVEAVKWKKLTEKSALLSLKTALKSVLAGLTTGYITPNRLGDFAGRILFLPTNQRLAGIALSIINSLTQNIVIVIFGLVGAHFYVEIFRPEVDFAGFFSWIAIGFGIVVLGYFMFPTWVRKFKSGNLSVRIRELVRSVSEFKSRDLTVIILISMIRYVVFCTQYYFLLRFFGVEVPLLQAAFSIPFMYLLITFTPSLAASEPAIRGSYAVLVFGVFSANSIGIMLTGILIWLVNFVTPMLVGTVIVGKVRNPLQNPLSE